VGVGGVGVGGTGAGGVTAGGVALGGRGECPVFAGVCGASDAGVPNVTGNAFAAGVRFATT
jgi:hypothetical protein